VLLQGVLETERVHAVAELGEQLAQTGVGLVERLLDVTGVFEGLPLSATVS
jgi:hypothetical protein